MATIYKHRTALDGVSAPTVTDIEDREIAVVPSTENVYVRTGSNVRQLLSTDVDGALYNIVLDSESTSTQTPLGTDLPMQVSFGPPQGLPTDPVQLSALGDITFNQAGEYRVRGLAHPVRLINAGVTRLLFYATLNGVQISRTITAAIPNQNSEQPILPRFDLVASAGDIVRLFMVRDSSGTDDGVLNVFTPTLTTINPVPSASIVVEKRK